MSKIQESCTFIPNKSFSQLLDISPKNVIFLKTFNLDFSYIEVWFTNLTLVINLSVTYKKCPNMQFNVEIQYL